MKKNLLFLCAVATLGIATASASDHWTLQSKEYTVDTIFHAKVGPGTTQTSLSLTGGSNLKIFYTTTDLTNPYVDIRVAQAGSRLTGGAKLSAMSSANTNSTTGIQYFAGVNADFFGNSQPIGASVVNGDVYKAPGTDSWISFYMNDSKVPGIELLDFQGTATAPDGTTHKISGINMGRGTDNLIIYNPHYAANTGTNAYGSEVVVTCDATIGYNGKFVCTVMGTPVSGVGSMSIPAGQYVLSGHGTANTFVSNLKSGDKVELNLNTELATGGIVTQMAGGQPIILRDGVTLETQNALDHLTALNPRTAVGYNKDRTKLILLVVDGRGKGGSAGVVSKVLADIMRYVGCSDAMNFDGGGSSELYTIPFGIRNVPSDGTERTVVNSVWAVSTAPVDNQVAELNFSVPEISLPKYGYYQPTLYAFNQYDVIISTDFRDFTLSCPAELGEIVDGKMLFANGSGTYPLTATASNGVTATMYVTIGSAQPKSRLESVLVDGYRSYSAEIVADVNGTEMAVDNQAFSWKSDNTDVAVVNEIGLISGIESGTANITATVDDFNVTFPVTVEKPQTRYIAISDGSTSDWTSTKGGVGTLELSGFEKGLAVDFQISSTRSPYITVKPNTEHVMYALPDSIRLTVNPKDIKISKITFSAGKKGERAVTSAVDVDLKPNSKNIVTVPVSDFVDTDKMDSYPVSFTSIRFDVSGNTNTPYRIEIPAITSVHNAVEGSDAVNDIIADRKNSGTSIMPTNVVKRGDIIELEGAESWTVFNLNGAIVARGNTRVIDTGMLPAGAFVVSTPTGAERLVVK